MTSPKDRVLLQIALAAAAVWSSSCPATAQTGRKVPSEILVVNARSASATQLQLESAGRVVTISRPLLPNGRSVVKSPAGAACTLTVVAMFADDAVVDATIDVCRDNLVRFTD